MKSAIAILLILGTLLLSAQTTGTLPRNTYQNTYSTVGWYGPVAIPTTGTDICTQTVGAACSSSRTVFILEITLSDESAAGDTCFIVDKQATPKSIFGSSAHPQPVTGTTIMKFEDRISPGGITWGCTAGNITGWIKYEY